MQTLRALEDAGARELVVTVEGEAEPRWRIQLGARCIKCLAVLYGSERDDHWRVCKPRPVCVVIDVEAGRIVAPSYAAAAQERDGDYLVVNGERFFCPPPEPKHSLLERLWRRFGKSDA